VGAGLLLRWSPSRPNRPEASAQATARDAPGTRTARRTSGRAVPVLANSHPGGQLETRPGAPGYDPRKLASLMGMAEVFRQEPRAPTWAGAVESRLTGGLAADLERLAPGTDLAQQLSIECHTTTCRIAWPDPAQPPVMHAAVTALYTPVRTGYGAKNEMYVAYYGGDFYRNVHALDAPSLFAELARLRARNLRTMRKDPNVARINRWDRVPAELWPEK
jgi:hypothetical protein